MNPLSPAVQVLLRDLERYAPTSTHIEVEGSGSHFSLYTATNRYRISFRVPEYTDGGEGAAAGSVGYLGCIATSRTPRAGETWCRGNDLPDGPFNRDTWRNILAAIVSYEMVRVHAPITLTPLEVEAVRRLTE